MFKGLTIYQLTQDVAAVEERLTDALGEKNYGFTPCKAKDPKSSGFVEPLGPSSEGLTFETDNAVLFCVRTDEKAVPPAAVKNRVNEIVKQKEDDGEAVNKTDLRLIKEDVVEKLLPGAVAAPKWTYAYLDKSLAMLFVGASDDDSDAFIEWLKKPLGGVPFILLGLSEVDPCAKFTEWMRDPGEHLGESFNLGNACSLKHAKEGGTAVLNINHEDLEAEDLAALLEAGKQCCRVALEHEALHFAITAKLGLRRVTFSDEVKQQLKEDDDGVPTTQRANEFAKTVAGVRTVLADLEKLLGGWPKQETLDLRGDKKAA